MATLNLTTRINNGWGVCAVEIKGPKGDVAQAIIEHYKPQSSTVLQGKKRDLTFLLPYLTDTYVFRINIQEGNLYHDPETGLPAKAQMVFLYCNSRLATAVQLDDAAQDLSKMFSLFDQTIKEYSA